MGKAVPSVSLSDFEPVLVLRSAGSLGRWVGNGWGRGRQVCIKLTWSTRSSVG